MSATPPDPSYTGEQYRSAANLNARIRLHQFSTNPYGWQRWVFDHFKFPEGGRVLELGCGTGNLWLENAARIPPSLEITLSDFSQGMVAQAVHNLAGLRPLRFEVIDAQSIPFPPGYFDAVIANHMLYHVPDRPAALAEMRRVLKPGGWAYATTVGQAHLRELSQLVARFDARYAAWGRTPVEGFTLENGAQQFEAFFQNVTLSRYPDALRVNNPQMLTEYILSGWFEAGTETQARLAQFVAAEVAASGGVFYITKDSGLFEAR